MEAIIVGLLGWAALVAVFVGAIYGMAGVWWLWDQISPRKRAEREANDQRLAWYRAQPGPKPWDDG